MPRRLARMLFLAILTATPAKARLNLFDAPEPSLECLVHQCPLIVRVRVTELKRYDYRLTFLETLKAPDDLETPVSVANDNSLFGRVPGAGGREYLLLLSQGDYPRSWTPWDADAAIPLDGGPQLLMPVRSMDFTIPETRQQVLRAVRAAIIDVPPKADQTLEVGTWGVAGGYPDGKPFVIPRTDRARLLAHAWARSPDPGMRKNAVRVLAEFPAQTSIDALKRLLADPHLEPLYLRRPRSAYTIRRAAIAALRKLNATFDEPATESPTWQRAFAGDHATGLGAAAALVVGTAAAYVLGRRRRRRRGLHVERLSVPRLSFAAVALGAALLAGATGYYWWQGHRGGTMFRHTDANGPYWCLKSDAGKLQFHSISHDSEPNAITDWGPDDFDIDAEFRTAKADIHDFGGRFLYLTVPDGDTTHTLLQVPFWFPTALACGPPAIWLLRQRRFARRRTRAATGCCLHCGYDLRHSPGRCPECGRSATP